MQHPTIDIMPAEMDSTDQYYHWAKLDPDGVLRQYKYPKREAVRSGLPAEWTVVQAVPANICNIVYSDFGSGVCGYNSYCMFNWNQTETECSCAPHYSFFDTERKYKGCKPDFALQSCDLSEAQVLEQFQMIPMNNIDWPLRAYEEYYPINETTCQSLCLNVAWDKRLCCCCCIASVLLQCLIIAATVGRRSYLCLTGMKGAKFKGQFISRCQRIIIHRLY
jgi:hypothetical protein